MKKYEMNGTKTTTNIIRDVCVKLTTNKLARLSCSAMTSICVSAPGITLKIAVSVLIRAIFLKQMPLLLQLIISK